MLDFALPSGRVQPPAAIDDVGTELARAFVDAVVAADFDRLETLFAPHLRFRALTPRACLEASTAPGARAIVEDWFGETNERALRGSTVERVGDRLLLGYRLELTEDGERRIVQQHLVAIADGAVFCDLAIVCSGFRPLPRDPGGPFGKPGSDARADDRAEAGAFRPAAAFKPAASLDATGLSCATLTPTIAATVRGLDAGAVLEIVTDDAGAEEGLRSWTRLTGNELVSAGSGPGPARRFGIRRTPRDAASSTRKGTD